MKVGWRWAMCRFVIACQRKKRFVRHLPTVMRGASCRRGDGERFPRAVATKRRGGIGFGGIDVAQ